MSDAPSTSQPQATGTNGPGERLLAERRRQNLSLGDVSRQLKLSVRQVEALERDDFSGFQSAVFVHGFLRNYAKLLGLDPAPLIKDADQLMAPSTPTVQPEPAGTPVAGPRGRAPWPMVAVAAVAVVALALIALYPRTPRQVPTPEAAVPATQVAVTQEAAPPAARGADKRKPARSGTDKAQAGSRQDQESASAKESTERRPDSTVRVGEEKPEVAEEATSTEGTASAEVAATDDPQALMILRMVFEEESWVEVKDRHGVTVFGQLNPAGTRRLARGEPPLSVVVGNAAGVKLYVDDKSIDLAPHTRVDVARLTIE